jgi:hypothetical protein
MRTTLDIADDVLNAARDRARREKRSLGEVISDLARQGLNSPLQPLTARAPKAVHGVRPFPKRGGVVTNELIDKLREDDAY